jgi:hypothetical protein
MNGDAWKAMSDKEKAPWMKMQEKDQARHDKQVKE